MGTDNSGNTTTTEQKGTTVITSGTTLTGDISLAGTLHLDGRLEGSLVSTDDVSIGKNGSVKGKIHAVNIYIKGLVEGGVVAQNCSVLAGGRVTGEIKSKSLSLEMSSDVNANTFVNTDG